MMKRLDKEQNGFVSIFSALILMTIISLITIGFTYSTNRSLRRTLDDQLNTQAFYAAESGVNDAVAYLNGGAAADKTSCDSGGGSAFNYTVDSGLNVGYSCVLIDVDPPEQVFSPVPVQGTDKAIVTNVSTASNINSIVFKWDSTQPSLSNPRTGGFGGGGTFPPLPPKTTWGNDIGIVRVDLVPVGLGLLDRQNLVDNSYTFFLYPTNTNYNVAAQPGQANSGVTLLTNCNSTGLRCQTEVFLGGPARNQYQMRLQSLYNPTQVTFGPEDAGGTALNMIDGQAIIDSTGRANDVFRRLQVRVPLSEVVGYTDPFALNSANSICKRLQVSPAAGNNIDAPTGYAPDECTVD